jgi:hypothetical protein
MATGLITERGVAFRAQLPQMTPRLQHSPHIRCRAYKVQPHSGGGHGYAPDQTLPSDSPISIPLRRAPSAQSHGPHHASRVETACGFQKPRPVTAPAWATAATCHPRPLPSGLRLGLAPRVRRAARSTCAVGRTKSSFKRAKGSQPQIAGAHGTQPAWSPT